MLRTMGFGYIANLTLKNTPKIQYLRGDYTRIPPRKIGTISKHILSAYSGPYGGLTNIVVEDAGVVHDESEKELIQGQEDEENTVITTEKGLRQLSIQHSSSGRNYNDQARRIDKWNLRKDWAYGISLSLYENKNDDVDDNKECTGDPVADVIAIKTTENSAILGLADGCGWGYGARRAARCAIKGCMEYIERNLYQQDSASQIHNTTDIFRIMRESIDEGQKLVIGSTATLTTLVLSVVVPMANSRDFAVCTVNVGDSLAYVFSEEHGVRELTIGSRDMESHRNIRFCDGALGPALGEAPDLTNMTFSISVVKRGDIVILTSDGVSDNFDPVIAGEAEASPEFDGSGCRLEPGHDQPKDEDKEDNSHDSGHEKPVFSPAERQEQTELMMNEVLRTDNMPNDDLHSAQVVCSKLLQFAIENTNNKRSAQQSANAVLESAKQHKEHDTPKETVADIRKHLRSLPGKLDHASVVAFVVGHHGIPEESEEEE
ncbi:uncharacterized protein [Amphiura filiformis]|uniref:uncharacterized protein n=1 Tax=Amphiura filiformis TaxID=82378 RepID=UPI003B225049